MWAELKRIVKRNGAIVLFGSQPFTSALVMSNPQMFKYELVWDKQHSADFLLAQLRPLKYHENLCVFSYASEIYNPQKWQGEPNHHRKDGDDVMRFRETLGQAFRDTPSDVTGMKYPRSIIAVQKHTAVEVHHPNEKPVELLRYLVRTYTNEGDTVLDFTCGSGTTGVACVIERRQFIGIEQDAHYCEVSSARIKRAQGVACDIPKRVKQYAPTPLFEAVA